MALVELNAWPREERGTRPCNRLRRQGLVPAVLYGRDEPNVLLKLKEEDLEDVLEQHAFIVELQWDTKSQPAQIKELQVDQLEDVVLHADFARISMSEKIEVSVPLDVIGEPAGVSEGGVLEMQQMEVTVECLPVSVPESIEMDVSELEMGDALHVRDLELPAGITVLDDPERVTAAVVSPTEIEEEEEAPEEMFAEPEVISREEEEEELAEEELEGEAAEEEMPEE